jgi:transcriptional regulator with XRE-family HTH domain
MQIHHAALRTIRERSGMTVTALAAASGIKQSHLSNIELGKRPASDELIIALAKALKVDLPSILRDPYDTGRAA